MDISGTEKSAGNTGKNKWDRIGRAVIHAFVVFVVGVGLIGFMIARDSTRESAARERERAEQLREERSRQMREETRRILERLDRGGK